MYVDHGGYGFLITYAAVPGKEDTAPFDDIAAKTVWADRKPVADSVASRGEPAKLLGGLTCDLPDPLRLEKAVSDHQEIFVATDYATGKPAIKLVHIVEKADAGVTLQKLTDDFAEQFGVHVKWTTLADKKTAISETGHADKFGDIQGVVTITADNVVHYFLLSTAPPAGDVKAATAAAKLLAESIASKK